MKVGYKYVLHSNAFPNSNPEPDRFVVVTVVEVKNDVRDMWTNKNDCTGLRAVDATGKEYFCCWEVFPSDSHTPMWRWHSLVGKIEEWFDLTYVTLMGEFPVSVPDCLKLDFLHYCEKHHEFTYLRNPGDTCWQCALKNGEEDLEPTPKGDVIPWGFWTRAKPKPKERT